MNRLQFVVSLALSGLLALCLLLQVIFSLQAQSRQVVLAQAEQTLNEGQASYTRLQQLANRIYQVGEQQHDQELSDLLNRSGLTVKVAPVDNAPASATATH